MGEVKRRLMVRTHHQQLDARPSGGTPL